MNIGILSLQGNYSHHFLKLSEMGVECNFVRDKNSLFKCDGLIIPGGESTTMSNLLDFQDLRQSFDEIKRKTWEFRKLHVAAFFLVSLIGTLVYLHDYFGRYESFSGVLLSLVSFTSVVHRCLSSPPG